MSALEVSEAHQSYAAKRSPKSTQMSHRQGSFEAPPAPYGYMNEPTMWYFLDPYAPWTSIPLKPKGVQNSWNGQSLNDQDVISKRGGTAASKFNHKARLSRMT